MNFVFISPHFPPNYSKFAIHLKKMGANVLGISDQNYDSFDSELQNSLTDYYKISDLNDYDQFVRAIGWFTHKYGRIDYIESFNEFWLELEAKIRTDFNIAGFNNETIYQIKKKSLMKQGFIDAGVSVAMGCIVENSEQVEEFISQVGFPVIAKPNIGVGALKTYKINNESEMEQFLENRPSDIEYFMEEFVEGKIVSFDGLVDKDGKIVFSTVHEYSQGVMEIVNNDDDIYYYSMRDLPLDLKFAGEKLVEVFDVKARFFHFEFFRTKNGDLVALEVNMRPPGGLTTDMFNYANDIDVYQEFANVIIHGEFKSKVDHPYHCAYVGQKHNKKYTHTHEVILNNLKDNLVHHQPIAGVFSSALGNYGYILRSTDLEEIKKMAGYIQEKSV
jgi:biotin carboxylase